MSKNLKRVAALVIALSICMSMFAMLSAHAYEATISGWPTKDLDSKYTWFADGVITEEEKEATRSAAADELAYQNDGLGFKIGTQNDGTTAWSMDDGSWSKMVAVQIENKYATLPANTQMSDITGNTGNPWSDASRVWGLVSCPFVGMAFSVKADFAANYPSSGNMPVLSNEFVVDGVAYQVYWDNYVTNTNGDFQTVALYPGGKSATAEVTGNKFRYAMAAYNQNNKQANLTVGYPTSRTLNTEDGGIFYQRFTGPSGNALMAVNAAAVGDGELTGAYVIPAEMMGYFEKLGADNNARFAVTGAPVADAANGKQAFENGTLSAAGFQSNTKEITAFSFADEPVSAVIDEESLTINAFVGESANLASLNPTVTHTGKSITPTGAQDFSNPVAYTVTAEDGSTKTYTVTAYKLKECDITSFVIDGVSAKIDYATKTITAVVGGDYNLKQATAEIKTVNAGATVTPASGETVDLSASWTNGVTFKSTMGSSSSTYTVQIRNKSKDTSITSFVIPDGQLKYQSKNGAVAATINGTLINLMMEYGNTTSQQTIAEVEVAEGATISPDPSVKRKQSGTKYVVTAEAGNTQTYTVSATMDTTDPTFAPVTDAELGLTVNFMTGKFNKNTTEKARLAILNEYNNQRAMGTDPGTPVGKIEGWDSLLNRQFFDEGYPASNNMNLGTDAHGSALIMIDVPNGKAYTLKGQMLSMWTWGATDEDGNEDWLFAKAGAPAVNEFQMDGKTYQQFAHSYAYYSNSSSAIIRHGIGSFSASKQVAALENSYWYSGEKHTLSDVTYSFRQAYERANVIGYNPGIADGGASSLLTYENGGGLQFTQIGETNSTFREQVTVDSKGQKKTEIVEGTFPNYVLYQVFTGSGELNDTDRSSANKTVIIKGTNELGVDNGGGIALFGDIKTMYESLPGEKVDMTIEGVAFKYNRTLGTPMNYLINDEGDIIMTFIKNTLTTEENDEGEMVPAFEEELGYYIAPGGDLSKIQWIEGDYVSGENKLSTVRVDNAEAEIRIINQGDVYDKDNPEDENARTFKENAIYINYPAGATVDVTKIQFTQLVPVESTATVIEPAVEANGQYAAVDCSIGGMLQVKAENESVRGYMVYVFQDGVSVMDELIAARWGYWTDDAPLEVTYPYYDESRGLWIYDKDPNAALKDSDGKPLWVKVWGYYIDDVVEESNWVTIAKVGEWNPYSLTDGWEVYKRTHFS
ncbi:MAG: DUF5018 domain-containing protein [Candidatus Howiella sp.]|jgi:hypothetical protein